MSGGRRSNVRFEVESCRHRATTKVRLPAPSAPERTGSIRPVGAHVARFRRMQLFSSANINQGCSLDYHWWNAPVRFGASTAEKQTYGDIDGRPVRPRLIASSTVGIGPFRHGLSRRERAEMFGDYSVQVMGHGS